MARWAVVNGGLATAPCSTPYEVIKRIADVIGAGTAIMLAFPGLIVVGALVLMLMGHPVLFIHERPGLAGRPFRMVKFRTMREGEGADASRLTRLGRLLRRLSLDELPELWNVLKGDMSLVGPRPLLMEYLDRYTPEQARRHEVKPGITGWAQVNGRNAVTWERKFASDTWYVDNRSFWLDAGILALTIWKVLKREGISQQGQATASEFTGGR